MSQEQNAEYIFNELQEIPTLKIIGMTLRVVRISKHCSKRWLSIVLRKKFGWQNITAKKIDKIECGEIYISFNNFKDICSALDYTVEKVLKCAISIRNDNKKTAKELLKEIQEEIEYEIWAKQQEN